jgi:hypothetical protein
MNRCMFGVKLSDRNANAELLSRLSIKSVSYLGSRGRLRLFGHLEFKEPDDWASACRSMVVESAKGRARGRPKMTVLTKTWKS